MKGLVISLFYITLARAYQWTRIHPGTAAGAPILDAVPAGRRNAMLACHRAGEHAYMLGGKGVRGQRLNDVWVWRNNRWHWRPPAPFSPRSGGCAWLTSAMTELWVYGGRDDAGNALEDVWFYDFLSGTWHQHIVVGSSGPPGGRYGMACWHNNDTDDLCFFGGKNNASKAHGDVWCLRGNRNWIQIVPPADERDDPLSFYDNGLLHLLGGKNAHGGMVPMRLSALNTTTFVWKSYTSSFEPYPAQREDGVLWALNQDFFVFGGKNASKHVLTDGTSLLTNEQWTMDAVPDGPSPRWGHVGCLLNNDQFIMFGGISEDDVARNDVWLFTQSETPAPPPKAHILVIVLVSVFGGAVIIFISACTVYYYRRKRKGKQPQVGEDMGSHDLL